MRYLAQIRGLESGQTTTVDFVRYWTRKQAEAEIALLNSRSRLNLTRWEVVDRGPLLHRLGERIKAWLRRSRVTQ